MERMSALDASFLEVADGVTHMHIGSVGLFEGPLPLYCELRGMVLGSLRFRRHCHTGTNGSSWLGHRDLWSSATDPQRPDHLQAGLPACQYRAYAIPNTRTVTLTIRGRRLAPHAEEPDPAYSPSALRSAACASVT